MDGKAHETAAEVIARLIMTAFGKRGVTAIGWGSVAVILALLSPKLIDAVMLSGDKLSPENFTWSLVLSALVLSLVSVVYMAALGIALGLVLAILLHFVFGANIQRALDRDIDTLIIELEAMRPLTNRSEPILVRMQGLQRSRQRSFAQKVSVWFASKKTKERTR